MPGKPITRQFERNVEAAGGERHMLDRIIAGESHREIGLAFGVSRTLIIQYFRSSNDPGRLRRYEEARALSAVAHLEEADAILAAANGGLSADVQKAKHRADLRRWLAERYDRDTYGQREDVRVHVDFGEQLLGVLRRRGRPVLEGEATAIGAEGADGEDAALADGDDGNARLAGTDTFAERAAELAGRRQALPKGRNEHARMAEAADVRATTSVVDPPDPPVDDLL